MNTQTATAPKNSELVDQQRIAELLGVSTTTIYRMAKAGLIPVHDVGRLRRYDYAEVKAHLRRQAS